MSSIHIEKEKKLLEKTHRDAFLAENQKDIDKLLDYLAEDIIVFPSSSPMIKGKKSMRELYERFLSNVDSMTGEPKYVDVSDSGDLGWDYGFTTANIKTPDGVISERRKYLAVWRKLEDKWKCIALSTNKEN